MPSDDLVEELFIGKAEIQLPYDGLTHVARCVPKELKTIAFGIAVIHREPRAVGYGLDSRNTGYCEGNRGGGAGRLTCPPGTQRG